MKKEALQKKRDKLNYGRGHTTWTSSSKYVDLDTGEELTKHRYKTSYIHEKTDKNVRLNKHKTQGHIEYINGGRRSTQGELPFI